MLALPTYVDTPTLMLRGNPFMRSNPFVCDPFNMDSFDPFFSDDFFAPRPYSAPARHNCRMKPRRTMPPSRNDRGPQHKSPIAKATHKDPKILTNEFGFFPNIELPQSSALSGQRGEAFMGNVDPEQAHFDCTPDHGEDSDQGTKESGQDAMIKEEIVESTTESSENQSAPSLQTAGDETIATETPVGVCAGPVNGSEDFADEGSAESSAEAQKVLKLKLNLKNAPEETHPVSQNTAPKTHTEEEEAQTILKKGDKAMYRQRDGTLAAVDIVSVDHGLVPPSYVIRIDGRERETERSRLVACC
mmetsp:Transcript_55600/g.113647  ORF Transcript_55600/g.113647 Transcript_55600/m.113647 type:complete len:303 (+) Transcript_55600:111-1019(+)